MRSAPHAIAAAPPGELASIQYLRAVAALLVVLFHVFPQMGRMGYAAGWHGPLTSGVDIFFVISGFIMWVTTYGRQVSPAGFIYKRIVRIVPLYWVLSSMIVAIMLLAPTALQSARVDLGHIIASYLFIPWPHPVLGTMEPVLVPGWTLNYEMFFYVLFAAALVLAPGRRLAVTLIALAAVVALGLTNPPPGSPAAFYTQSIILEFALGLMVGAAYTAGWRIPAPAAICLVLLGALAIPGLWAMDDALPRALLFGLPAACIVAGAVSVEAAGLLPRIPFLRLLGDASYSLYLSHGVALSALSQGWRHLGLTALPGSMPLFALASLLASILLGIAVYRLIERPLIALFRGFSTAPGRAAFRSTGEEGVR